MTRLYAVVVLPPPYTGMTIASQSICKALADRCDFFLYPTRRDPQWGDLRWRIQKHLSLLAFVAKIPRNGKSNDSIYFVVDSRLGLLGSCLLVVFARLRGFRLVAHHHVWSYVRNSTFLARVFFFLAGRDTVHITLCETMEHSIRSCYPRAARVVVVNNLDLLSVEQSEEVVQTSKVSQLGKGRLNLGMLGNLTLDKGVAKAVEVVSVLADRGHSVSLHLAGPLSAEVAELLSESRGRLDVNAIGPIFGPDKEAFLADLDLLLFPSEYINEADPLVVWEALLAGTPVVSTDVGCLAGERPGLLSLNRNEFTDRAVELCIDQKQLEELTTNASAMGAKSAHLESLDALVEALA